MTRVHRLKADKYCHTCKQWKPLDAFAPNGKKGRYSRCRDCYNRYAQVRPLKAPPDPLEWDTIVRAYHLTEREQKAVRRAAKAMLKLHTWKAEREGPRPRTPESITDAAAQDVTRRCELLGATSKLAKRLLHERGCDAGAFFNRHVMGAA